MSKTFLLSRFMRRGSETLSYVTREDKNYWLGTYYELIPKGPRFRPNPYHGTGNEYGSCGRVRISKEFYRAFLAESKRLHTKYRGR